MSERPVMTHREMHAELLLVEENHWDTEWPGRANPYRIAREDREQLERVQKLKFPPVKVQE